jgi:beta-glucosidase
MRSTDLHLSSSKIGPNENFSVTVTVHNTGSVAGKEVVQVLLFFLPFFSYVILHIQVYITDLVSSVVTPNQELVGFQKVAIPYVIIVSISLAC